MLALAPTQSPETGNALSFCALTPKGSAMLAVLRDEAARCRVAPHLDLFEACSLLTLDETKASERFATALLRTLSQALGQRVIVHSPGSGEISFDEAWLLRLMERLSAGDNDSAAFLLSRRVPQMYRRSLIFLLRGIVADWPQPAR